MKTNFLTRFIFFLLFLLNIQSFAEVRPFDLRHMVNIGGNIKVIGNTVLVGADNGSSNADLDLRYADVDAVSTTFNSSSAALIDADIQDPSTATVAWAGLYWQSYLHTWDTDFRGSTNNPYRNTSWSEDQILTTINSQSIKFTTPAGITSNVTPTKIDPLPKASSSTNNDYKYSNVAYSCFANVTSLMQGKNPLGQYTVANIPAQEGDTRGGTFNDGLGNYGAWTLVVIYNNPSDPNARMRNISVFDGYQKLAAAGTSKMTIPLSGFMTPRVGLVDSSLSIFAGEGDKHILGDYAQLRSETGVLKDLSNAPGTGSYFASSITGVPTRNPNLANNNGIDIHSENVGSANAGLDVIGNNQIAAEIIMGTTGDTYFPSMAAFATELYKPQLCYDYSVQKNGYTLNSDNRDILTVGTGELTINPSIRSMEGDFDLENTKIKVRLTPTAEVNFLTALYSPNTVNTLIPAIFTLDSTSLNPEIAIGMNATPNGGTISIFERYFAQFKYQLLADSYSGHFDIDLNTSIDFGSGPIDVLLSSQNGSLPRCAQSPTYQPQWGAFNIERTDSGLYNTIDEPESRFPLYTQVVGKDFDFSVVAYDGNATPPYATEISVHDMTVDIELIDASAYDDNSSFFKCNNTDISIIQELPNGETSSFVTFPPAGATRVDITAGNDIITDTALKNAAFRMWLLVDENDTIVPHTCTDKNDNACFETVYSTYLETADTTGYCTNCSSYAGGCYACLRNFFAKPICSRDNFAIRPASYRIDISDTDELNASNAPRLSLGRNDVDTTLILAAEYQYRIDANATQYNSDQFARQYMRDFYTPSNTDIVSQFTFQASTGTGCTDTSDADIGVRFENGQVAGTYNGTQINLNSNSQSHNNVGDYLYHIEDNNWTMVDQQRFPFKTFQGVDDCIFDNFTIATNGTSRSGCGISSNLTYNASIYQDLGLQFRPYTYDVAAVAMNVPNINNVLYVNELNTSNLLDRAMAVHFNGPLVARGKLGTQLSNYTQNCAALPVIFDIDRNVTQNGIQLQENSIESIDPEGYLPNEPIYLQRYNSSQDVDTTVQYSPESGNADTNRSIIIPALQFKDENNGSTIVSLDYNFQRKSNMVSNPLNVTFNFSEANSTLAASSAHMRTQYIPEGNATLGNSVNFIYGRVAPSSNIPYIAIPGVFVLTVPMYVEAYCAGIDCSLYALGTPSPRDNGTWWVNTNHSSPNNDGNIASITEQIGSTILTITPKTNININNPTDIIVTIPTAAPRTYNSTLSVKPDRPWLGADCGGINLNPCPIVNFLGGGGWAGKGNTGMVVDTNASHDINNKRIGW